MYPSLWILTSPWKQINKKTSAQVTQAVHEARYRKINGKMCIWNKKTCLIIHFSDLLYLSKVKFAYSWKGIWTETTDENFHNKINIFVQFPFLYIFFKIYLRIFFPPSFISKVLWQIRHQETSYCEVTASVTSSVLCIINIY